MRDEVGVQPSSPGTAPGRACGSDPACEDLLFPSFPELGDGSLYRRLRVGVKEGDSCRHGCFHLPVYKVLVMQRRYQRRVAAIDTLVMEAQRNGEAGGDSEVSRSPGVFGTTYLQGMLLLDCLGVQMSK